MALLLRSAVGLALLRRPAPVAAVAASRLFSSRPAPSNSNDLEKRIEKIKELLLQLHLDKRIEETKAELLLLYLTRKPALAAAKVEAQLSDLLRRFQAKTHHHQSDAGQSTGTSTAKDGAPGSESDSPPAAEFFDTEPYSSDSAAGYSFSGGSYSARSCSGNIFLGGSCSTDSWR